MRRERKRLGELLIEAGLLTEQALTEALAQQKKSGLKLGQYLVQSGTVKEELMVDAISSQLNIARYEPDKYPFEEGVDKVLPEDLARKHQMVPLKKKGHLLVVAMPDPMDINALDTVEIATNLEVEPVICSENDFEMLSNAIYGHSGVDEDVFAEFEDENPEAGAEDEEQELALDSLADMAEQAPVIRMVNSILTQAVRDKASDVHISPERDYVHVRYRIDGKLRVVPGPPKSIFLPLVSRIKIMANMDIAVSKLPQDGRFSFQAQNREFNVRVSSLPTIYGENIVMRLLDKSAQGLGLDELGLVGSDMKKLSGAVAKPYGMILAAGPTGSGKSTTLYSILRRINQPDINIITLEDPVEYRVDKIRQVQLNRKAGMTFASGLRTILRQDPDVILVGEIRDDETAKIAVQASLTGHKVLSTLHTNDAAGSITRLIEMGVEPYLVASTLLVSVSQRLVRKNCTHCMETYDPPEHLLKAFGIAHLRDKVEFKRGTGCPRCGQTGYRGRAAVFEILPINDMVQDMILSRASASEIGRAAVRAKLLRTLKLDGASKVVKGVTTLEEAAGTIMT